MEDPLLGLMGCFAESGTPHFALFGSNVYFCTLFGGIQTFPLVLVCLNGYVARTI